ncbi:MAG: hypothetical protein WBO35_04270 [Candidatus Saccharimonadales bacterium]
MKLLTYKSYRRSLQMEGFSHHLLLPVLAVLAVAGIGGYLTFASKAATPGITSGRMAYSTSVNGISQSATIESDGRSELKLSDKLIIGSSWDNNWILVKGTSPGTYDVYSSDLKKTFTYNTTWNNSKTCADGASFYSLYNIPSLAVSSSSTTTPPQLIYTLTTFPCSNPQNFSHSLNTRLLGVSPGSTPRSLFYDGADDVVYKLLFNGAKSILLTKYPSIGGSSSYYYVTSDGIAHSLPSGITPLALTRDGTKYVGAATPGGAIDIYSYTGTKIASTGLKMSDATWANNVLAIANDASMLLVNQSRIPLSGAQRLAIYKVSSKQIIPIDSGIGIPQGSGFQSVFSSVTFSPSDGLVGYVKNDNKYKSLTIRRNNTVGTQMLVTKTLTFNPAGFPEPRMFW